MEPLARAGAVVLRTAGLDAACRAAGDRGRLSFRPGATVWRRRPCPPIQILIYHRVAPGPSPFAIDAVPLGRFTAQMEHVARAYRVLPLEELHARAIAGTVPPGALAITFDDGYADNLELAHPVLARLGLPAAVFLVTGCVGTGEVPWHDRVLRAFERTPRRSAPIPGAPGQTALHDASARRAAAFRALALLKPLPESERLDSVRRLATLLDAPDADAPGQRLMLDWDQVRALHRAGWAIGSHTVTHPILSRQDPARVREELTSSKRVIEEALGAPVVLFAYPNGRPEDYTEDVVRRVGEAGYRVAVTTTFGTNEAGDDPLRWRRGTPWEPDAARFALKLAYYRAAAPSGPIAGAGGSTAAPPPAARGA